MQDYIWNGISSLRSVKKNAHKIERSRLNREKSIPNKLKSGRSTGHADFSVTMQGQLIKVKGHNPNAIPPQTNRSVRGSVQYFSRKSRKRMIETVSRINPPKDTRFVTLTWSDDVMPADTREVQRQLKVLFQRMRRASESMSAVWRIELKARQSGRLIGVVVPHVHMLVFNAGDLALPSERYAYDGWFYDNWMDITGHQQLVDSGVVDYGIKTDDVMLNGSRQVMYYVSKYAAKMDEQASPLVNAPYQHTGRFWGVVQAEAIPWAECIQITVKNARKAYFQLRRACQKRWSGVSRNRPVTSWTMFVSNTEQWHELIFQLVLDDDSDMVLKPVLVYNQGD